MFIQGSSSFSSRYRPFPVVALAAALPREWSVIQIYFSIVLILSLVKWGGLARVVRGKLLELREHDFTMAARIAGMREAGIIVRHLLPSFASYLIVHLTLAIPDMIIAETALSFLGLGMRSPALSWECCCNGAEFPQHRRVPVAADSRAVRGHHRDGIQFPGRRPARCSRSLQALNHHFRGAGKLRSEP